MKQIKYILSAVLVTLTMSACVWDLNVTPIDPNANTADKALVDEAAYTNFLAGVYMGFATSGYYGANGGASISGLDGGASQYVRGLYHHSELTTDESVCGWNDQTIKNFHWMNWTTDDTFIYAFYSRIFMVVGMANEFIREAKASPVEFAAKQQMIDEARVVRAIAYYHGIDNFGNIPFADETAVVGALPTQIKRADLYDWLVNELTDLINNSALPERANTAYGHVNKSVAKFLLAKVYLNAEVFKGEKAYDKCAAVLKDLMDDGYSLHTSTSGDYNAYQELFLADNNRCTDEIIFAIEQDGINTTSYGCTNYIIFASTGGEMDPDEMGISSGWGGLRTTPQFYGLFADNDARNLFYTATQQNDIDDIGEFSHGIAFRKFRNRTSDGGYGKEAGFVDTDFPMMRYADVLLMAAECEARGAAVDGYKGFNDVRKRAGLAAIATPTLQQILDERGRELYQECWRRNDLIRFGQFTSGNYLWQWKGNVKEGKAVDEGRNLFPIPDSDLLANSNLEQNDYYKTATE
jgi:hypothetical protein